MNKPEKIELSGFVTTETRQGRRRFNRGSMQKGGRGRKRSGSFTSSGASSMLLKLGICAAACALVLLIKWVDTPLTNSAQHITHTPPNFIIPEIFFFNAITQSYYGQTHKKTFI